MSSEQARDLLSRLPDWSQFLDSYELPPAMASEPELFELRLRLVNLRRRLRDGPLAPLRIAFFGPTGAGKSKLFSSLVGRSVSPSGFRRPFTRRSCYYIHDDWRSLVPAIHGEAELHNDATWKDVILIDTPDFDSVDEQNRHEAERVFMESDGFLFVTDALKYADASTWEYMRKIQSSEKLCQVILNKVDSQAVPLSFEQRFASTFNKESVSHKDASARHSGKHPATLRPLIVVSEFPMDDSTLISQTEPAMQQLINATQQIGQGDRVHVSVEMFGNEATGLFTRTSSLLGKVEQRRTELERLQHRLGVRFEECRLRLADRLSSGLDPAVREEVFERVMKRMEKIDILRYPRRLLSMPVRGLKTLVTSWRSSPNDGDPVPNVSNDPITVEMFHLLETELIRLADETRIDVTKTPDFEAILSRERFRELRLDHSDVQKRFDEHQERFTDWVASHARDTAAEITGENKAKFILSQLLFNSVVIGAQVSTGGLAPWELGVDTVVSPWVAKAISTVIGNEKVSEFEAAARDEHQRSLTEILAVARDRFQDFFDEAGRGLDELEATLLEISDHASQRDALVRHFELSAGDAANLGGSL